jgi:hypothetical protein
MSEDIFLFDKPEYIDNDAVRYRLPCPIKGCGWSAMYHLHDMYLSRIGAEAQDLVERRMTLEATNHLRYDHDLWARAAAEEEIQIDLRSSGIYYDKHNNRYYGPYPT